MSKRAWWGVLFIQCGVAAGSASAFSENLATKEEIENVYLQLQKKRLGEEDGRRSNDTSSPQGI